VKCSIISNIAARCVHEFCLKLRSRYRTVSFKRESLLESSARSRQAQGSPARFQGIWHMSHWYNNMLSSKYIRARNAPSRVCLKPASGPQVGVWGYPTPPGAPGAPRAGAAKNIFLGLRPRRTPSKGTDSLAVVISRAFFNFLLHNHFMQACNDANASGQFTRIVQRKNLPWEKDSIAKVAYDPAHIQDCNVQASVGKHFLFNEPIPKGVNGQGYLRVTKKSLWWQHEQFPNVWTSEGVTTCMENGYQWTVNSTTWNHLQTMWQALPLDLLRLIYEETHHQTILEASGYRSPTPVGARTCGFVCVEGREENFHT
jgi:hypothetical protein